MVIVGGGFAGLGCAQRAGRSQRRQITLIDRNNYHQFQPLLYQVATSLLAPSDIAHSLRGVLPVPEHPLDDPDLLGVGDLDLDDHHGADRRFSHRDVSGWAKTAWVVLIIVLPFVGVLIYLIVYSAEIAERRA